MHSCRHLPNLEELESRYTPACLVRLNSPALELLVACDAARDAVTLDHRGTNTLITANDQVSSWPDGQVRTIRVRAGAGDDRITVAATGSGIRAFAFGEDGNDWFGVGTASGSLASLGGALILDGGAGQDAGNLDDSGTRLGSAYELDASQFDRFNGETITYTGVEMLLIWTSGTGNDIVTVQEGPPVGTTIAINFGGGQDTLVGPNVSNTWNITQVDQGTLNGTISFQQLESLTGGSTADWFVFSDGARMTGVIDGGDGANTLDYGQYSQDVWVNLTVGTTTGAILGIANIQNATGGSGNDLFVGDSAQNVFLGNQGNDILLGGTGGPDNLQGGLGDDILIAGWTDWDADEATLSAIKGVWTDPALNFSQRTSALAGYLNAQTVHVTTAPDTLDGGDDLDWLFVHAMDTALNGEQVEIL